MSIEDRRQLFGELETMRKRPVIVYITSSRQNAKGMMAGDAISEILDQIMAIPSETTEVDLLVVSEGGDGTVAWQIMSLLRERFKHVAVLVPQAAYSAATLLALGADEIVMHPNGNLGPVDPQIRTRRRVTGSDKPIDVHFGYEDLMGFLEFVRHEAKISDQKLIVSLFQQFCQEVGPVPIGTAARGSQLSISMGEKLLRMHMKNEADGQKARGIAETLNKKFFHHGYPVSRTEATEIGLKVADRNQNVESLMWNIWLDVEEELKIRKPFDPTIELMNSPVGGILAQRIPQVNLPPNLHPTILQQLVPQIVQQLASPGGTLVEYIDPVDIEWTVAIAESPRLSSRCVTKAKIISTRMPDLDLKVNLLPINTGWVKV